MRTHDDDLSHWYWYTTRSHRCKCSDVAKQSGSLTPTETMSILLQLFALATVCMVWDGRCRPPYLTQKHATRLFVMSVCTTAVSWVWTTELSGCLFCLFGCCAGEQQTQETLWLVLSDCTDQIWSSTQHRLDLPDSSRVEVKYSKSSPVVSCECDSC